MKTALLALSLLVATSSALAATTTVGVEYDYNNFTASNDRSHYGAIGVTEATDYGSFDAWVQGSRNTNGGSDVDNINGYEFGYARSGELPRGFTWYARTAIGDMRNFAPNREIATYSLTSVEFGHALSAKVNGYAGYSFMFGLNDFAIPASRRVQLGIDTAITPKLSLRTGLSTIRQLNTIQNGLVVITSYAF